MVAMSYIVYCGFARSLPPGIHGNLNVKRYDLEPYSTGVDWGGTNLLLNLYRKAGRPALGVRGRCSPVAIFATLLSIACAPNAYSQKSTSGDLRGTVLVGYQGWFRCPGDGSPGDGWSHWSKGAPTPDTMSIDLYPDTSELDSKSLCPLPAATIDGKPAYVFSSFPKETTEKHFQWMQTYDIDGALVQRFINSIPGSKKEGDAVLKNVRAAAEGHHRVFAVEYDLSGAHSDTVFQQMQDDWKDIEKLGITSSKAYIQLNGRPVVSIWGLGFGDGHHIVDPELALKIILWFKEQAGVAVIGGVPAGWASLSGDSTADPRWAKVYAAFDVVQPWTVGRYGNLDAAERWKSSHLVPDEKLLAQNHQLYMPVIFPGFSWHNLNHGSPENQIPRLGGEFLWKQAYNARIAGAPMVKIAMFDEVNEGTAIFKAVSPRDKAPKPGYWLTLDADGRELPNDWYLRITQEISRMFHGEIKPISTLPIKPSESSK
jgi:hypothetical protein